MFLAHKALNQTTIIILLKKVQARVVHQVLGIIDKSATGGFLDIRGIVQNPAEVALDRLPVSFHDKPVEITERDGHPEHEPARKEVGKKTNEGYVEETQTKKESFTRQKTS
jgi:hypothetical protein